MLFIGNPEIRQRDITTCLKMVANLIEKYMTMFPKGGIFLSGDSFTLRKSFLILDEGFQITSIFSNNITPWENKTVINL